MKEITGNIFDYLIKGNMVIVPTNATTGSLGNAIMGKGLALAFAKRFPDLPALLGDKLMYNRLQVYTFEFDGVFIAAFPTKYHYKENSDIRLIEQSARELVKIADEAPCNGIYLPRVGCGLGMLDWEKDVKPILENHFDNRFVIVDNKSK